MRKKKFFLPLQEQIKGRPGTSCKTKVKKIKNDPQFYSDTFFNAMQVKQNYF